MKFVVHRILQPLTLVLTACSDNPAAPPPNPESTPATDPTPSETSTVASGEALYRNVCVVCHNADPREPGTLGPAIAGASLPLLEAKVLRGEYPPGHTPVQAGATMPQYQFVAPKLPDLAAYLKSVQTKKD